jgi:hypothetical protein
LLKLLNSLKFITCPVYFHKIRKSVHIVNSKPFTHWPYQGSSQTHSQFLSFYPLCEGDALILELGEALRDVLTEGVELGEGLRLALGVLETEALTDGDALTEGVELTLVEALTEALIDEVVCGSSSDLKPFSVTLKPSIIYENSPTSSATKYMPLPIPQGKGLLKIVWSAAT